jgi:hypothetical protein
MRSNLPLPKVWRLSWLNAVISTGPRAMASRTSPRKRADSVNMTADGLVTVSVAISAESEACTTLPGSIKRTPMRPSLGATIEVRWGGFDRGPIGVDQSGDLIDQARGL